MSNGESRDCPVSCIHIYLRACVLCVERTCTRHLRTFSFSLCHFLTQPDASNVDIMYYACLDLFDTGSTRFLDQLSLSWYISAGPS